MMGSFKEILKATVVASLLCGVVWGVAVYRDSSNTLELLPEVLAARTCLQDKVAEYLPAGTSTFVDHYEEAYFAALSNKSTVEDLSVSPLTYAAQRTYQDYNATPVTYDVLVKLDKLVKDKEVNRCADDLAFNMKHWFSMTESVKRDLIDHKFRLALYGPGYYQDWPAYIAK